MSTALKLTQSVPTDINRMNKRPAPSQARLEKLKQLKNNQKKAVSSVSLQNDDKELFPKPDVIRATAPSLVSLDLDVSMFKTRRGDSLPKLHKKGDSRKRKTVFTLPMMRVKWQNLGKEGNLNKKIGNNTITDINKAHINVSLDRGCPDELSSLFPNLEKDRMLSSQHSAKSVESTWKWHICTRTTIRGRRVRAARIWKSLWIVPICLA